MDRAGQRDKTYKNNNKVQLSTKQDDGEKKKRKVSAI